MLVPEVVVMVLFCSEPSEPCTLDMGWGKRIGDGGELINEGITTGARIGVPKRSNTSWSSGSINSPSSTMYMSSGSSSKYG